MLMIAGLFVRLLLTALVVFGLYNPSGYSYYHWLWMESGDWTAKLFVGMVIAYILYFFAQATWRSMKLIGMVLVVGVFAALIWLLSDLNLIDLGESQVRALVALFGVASVFGVGVSWSLVRYRLSGQVDSQEIG